jgi:hypothetical protein
MRSVANDGCGVILLKNGGDGVDRDTGGAVFADGVLDALNEGREVEIADDVLAIGIGGGIEDEELAFVYKLLESPTEAFGVFNNVSGGLFKGDKDAGLVEVDDAVVEKLG